MRPEKAWNDRSPTAPTLAPFPGYISREDFLPLTLPTFAGTHLPAVQLLLCPSNCSVGIGSACAYRRAGTLSRVDRVPGNPVIPPQSVWTRSNPANPDRRVWQRDYRPASNQQRFAYPAYFVFLFLPLAVLPFPLAHAAGLIGAIGLTILSLRLWSLRSTMCDPAPSSRQ